MAQDGDVQCHCQRGYTGRRCEECDVGYVGNPMDLGGSCELERHDNCEASGTYQVLPDGRCECKTHVSGTQCNQCKAESFFLNPISVGGCVECFCMGVTKSCTSSSWFRDTIRTTFSNNNQREFNLVRDYSNPSNAELYVKSSHSEITVEIPPDDTNIYYWRLPTRFLGNKLTSYGGNLNYTVRYVPTPGGMSRNTGPDVVIHSRHEITIVHYSREQASTGSQSHVVPIYEQHWEHLGGQRVNREHLLMALSDISSILIKATYTTTSIEAGLSFASLDIANEHRSGSYVRANEVEDCSCPKGHQGLSCESCSPGYTRGNNLLEGLYIGLCSACECNGHSDECDAESSVCVVNIISEY